ncbi:MAG: DUF192 domain-containing protein [Nanoarchaeota archaeon]|nr:DUF192 domain-containing protein [Nanoarchaeota archaeon]
MKINLRYRGKILPVNDVKLVRGVKKAIGLMFKRQGKAQALLFSFKKPTKMAIHSLFVFFPFVAVWADVRGEVQEVKIVKPFTLTIIPKEPFYRLLEIPFNSEYKKIIQILVGTERFKYVSYLK